MSKNARAVRSSNTTPVSHSESPWAVLGAVLAALVLLMRYSAGLRFSISSYQPTSEELQAICNFQGHLQLMAEFPSDPVTAFELLELDPKKRPFSPPYNSSWPGRKWHTELLEVVENRYTKWLPATTHDRESKARATAITAAANLLSGDRPRRLYVDTVLPMIERVVRGQSPHCVWPRLREFDRNMCAATWAITGMTSVLEEKYRRFKSVDVKHCFGADDILNWSSWLGGW